MRDIGRPTEEELDRIEELVDEYFVGSSWGLDAKFWDDGDVHLTAYSTIGTNMTPGYPQKVVHHRQLIIYEREDEVCHYLNRVRLQNPRPSQELNRIEIDF